MHAGKQGSTHAVAPEIVPFWNRLGEIARYPLKSAALATIVVLSLCQLLTFLPLGLIGLLLELVTLVALYKYAFECLRATADGRLDPPEIAMSVDDGLGWRQIWLQVIFFVLVVLFGALFGGAGLVVGIMLVALVMPAATMSLAMDESLGNALNPGTWFQVISRFGAPYFAIAGLYVVFNISEAYAKAMVVPFLPPVVSTFALSAIGYYVVIATFHLMGYLIYQYHDEIGYEPKSNAPPLRRASDDPDQALLDEAAMQLREGRPEAAAELLRGQLRARGGSEAMHAQYHKLLVLLSRQDEMLAHAREWISALLALGNEKRAVELLRECLTLDPAFLPADPDDVGPLARRAVEVGSTQVAVKLVANYYRAHPRHADVPVNALLAAKQLTERMGKEDTARALLDRVIPAFPAHPVAEELLRYRAFLDSIASPPTSQRG